MKYMRKAKHKKYMSRKSQGNKSFCILPVSHNKCIRLIYKPFMIMMFYVLHFFFARETIWIERRRISVSVLNRMKMIIQFDIIVSKTGIWFFLSVEECFWMLMPTQYCLFFRTLSSFSMSVCLEISKKKSDTCVWVHFKNGKRRHLDRKPVAYRNR